MFIKDIIWFTCATYPPKIHTFITKHLANRKIPYQDLSNVPIVCINLPKRKDKRRFIEQQSRKHNLNIQCIRGITIEPIQRARLVRKGLVNLHAQSRARKNQLTNKEIGCFLAHMTIWDTLLTTDEPAILILEDDAKLNTTKKELIYYLKRVPKKADIYTLNLRHAKRTVLNYNTVKITNSIEGLTAYIITRKAAKKLLTNLQINEAVDEYISSQLQSKNLNIYGSTKDLFTETSTRANLFSYRFKSEIQNH